MIAAGCLLAASLMNQADIRIEVDAKRVLHPVSRYYTGACIEDVNHEIYGGLYSQMIFGESFQESATLPGLKAFGGDWRLNGAELTFAGSPGDRLTSDLPAFADGEVGVDVYVKDSSATNAGLIVRVGRPGRGVDGFDGYEVALNAHDQTVRLGRHRHNWEPVQDTPCPIPVGQWVSLAVKMAGHSIEVFVDGKSVLSYEDGENALLSGTFGIRQFQPQARYRNLWVKTGATENRDLLPKRASSVSAMWQPVREGSAGAEYSLDTARPFVGSQAQRMTFGAGDGLVGLANMGLNRQGMSFLEGKPYEGVLWVRAEHACDLFVRLQTSNGSKLLAEEKLRVKGGDWQRISFNLTPTASRGSGRFVIALKRPGAVDLGYASLQPGTWGRFKGLPVRKDVAQGLVDQGITVLRYGGSMILASDYRWKHMIGPRDIRPPYAGLWYPFSTNGWGIVDFLNFCEAAGFMGIPDFNIDESPQDMADFIEYANGLAESPWGRKRAADGHPAPYHLNHIELGNEERVDAAYFAKFKALADAIWSRDPKMILVVGDLAYHIQIDDPFKLQGADSGITTLAVHQKVMQTAKSYGAEVWFDTHVWTDGPKPDSTLAGSISYLDALQKISGGAHFKVAVFELNADNPTQRRALANALALNAFTRDGRLPVVTSANCLQPDGQNDNGWNQGLLFLSPSKTWLQPPGYLTRMMAEDYLPEVVQCSSAGDLDAVATRSEDGSKLSLRVVNSSDQPLTASIRLIGFSPRKPDARVTELSARLDAMNTAARPDTVVPKQSRWKHKLTSGGTTYPFPSHSVTILRFE